MPNRKLTFLLIPIIFAAVFLGGYHQFCDCYAHDCSICPHPDHQPFLSVLTGAAEAPQIFPALSGLSESVTFFPDPAAAFSSLNGRAPPSDAPCISGGIPETVPGRGR